MFDVSTASDQRRRGLASAAMHAALTLARERDGVRRAALQASPDGLGVYRRLGFGEVCRFHVHSNREAFSSI
nr:GNAT family N-acetyltransferase [Burkholderia gladioli]